MEDEINNIDKGIAIPFVVYSAGKFIITEEAKEIFNNPLFKSIGLISLVGKYRTGKSFLLNRVLLKQQNKSGFGVGPTIKPCTKGIWMWSKPIEVENNHHKEKFHTFFIDTEGLGAYDEEINHDSKIFLVAVLISSLFILNSFGNIDENSINSLSFILNISKKIKLDQNNCEANTNPEDLSVYFPSLLWLLRDFSLKLEDSQGNTITAKQYLENALMQQKGFSDVIEEKNKVRKLITSYFKERDCFSMVRPVENEKDLQNLQTLDDSEIRREFLDQADTLRNKVFKKVKPKVFNEKVLSGSMLIDILDSILDSINNGAVPVIENSWKYMLQTESFKNMSNITDKLKRKIEEFEKDNKENKKFFKDFEIFQQNTVKNLCDEFLKNAISPESNETKESLEKMKLKINEEFKKFYEENSKIFEKQLNEFLQENSKIFYETFETNNYYKNHFLFFRDLENFRENAESSIPDFTKKKDMLIDEMIIIIKKFIELVFLKNKNINDQEISILKGENKILTSKFNYKNDEYEKFKGEYNSNINRLNSQVLDLKLKEKSLEEKLNNLNNEKRTNSAINEENINNIKADFYTKLDKMKADEANYKNEIKSKEDQILMMKLSDDKLNALSKQKCEFLEKENIMLKERNDFFYSENESYKKVVDELRIKLENCEYEINKLKSAESYNAKNLSKNVVTKFKPGQNPTSSNFNNETELNIAEGIPESENFTEEYEEEFNENKEKNQQKRKFSTEKINYNNNNTNEGNLLFNSVNNSGIGLVSFNPDLQNQKIFEFLQDFRKEQLRENRQIMQEFKTELLSELGKICEERNEHKENSEIFKANILNLEKQNIEQSQKLNKLIEIKHVLKQITAVKCLFCGQIFEKEFFFSNHKETCKNFVEISSITEHKPEFYDDSLIANTKNNTISENNNILTTGNYLPNINPINHYSVLVKILEVEFLVDKNNNNYYDYLTEIIHDSNSHSKRIANLNKKFIDFLNLHFNLSNEFHDLNFPDSCIIFTGEYNFEAKINEKNIKMLENYLNEIGNHKRIISSNIYKEFFDIQIPFENNSFKNQQENSKISSKKKPENKNMKIEEFNSEEFEGSQNSINQNNLLSKYDMKINTKNEKNFESFKFDDSLNNMNNSEYNTIENKNTMKYNKILPNEIILENPKIGIKNKTNQNTIPLSSSSNQSKYSSLTTNKTKNLNINVASSHSNLQRSGIASVSGGVNDSRNSTMKSKQASKSKPRINTNK